jgi:hypothetical protein
MGLKTALNELFRTNGRISGLTGRKNETGGGNYKIQIDPNYKIQGVISD